MIVSLKVEADAGSLNGIDKYMNKGRVAFNVLYVVASSIRSS